MACNKQVKTENWNWTCGRD